MYFPKLVPCLDTMIFHCWSFIEFLFRQSVPFRILGRNSKGDIQSLPNDILIDILSRLPAESVLQCRRVCKRWRNLTSNSLFIELQFQTAKPLVIVHDAYSVFERFEPYVFSADEATRRLTITPICRYLMYLMDNNEIRDPVIISSCHGLILCRARKPSIWNRILFICNPLTHEMMTVSVLEKGAYACGFFFHPLAMEHRVLCLLQKRARCCFKRYSLETNSWREISCSYNVDLSSSDTIIANGSLHWLTLVTGTDSYTDFILRYDMNVEVFDTIPRPKCEDYPETFYRVRLLEVKGELGYVCIKGKSTHEVIDIWVLADSAKNHWVKRHNINLADHRKCYPPREYLGRTDVNYRTLIFGMYNDELLIRWNVTGLFTYNFERGTLTEIEYDRKLRITRRYYSLEFCDVYVYKESLVSLKQCLRVSQGKQMKGRKWKGMGGYRDWLSSLVQDLI